MAGLSVAGLLALGTWIGRQTEIENYLREAEILLSQDNWIVPWSWSPEPETLAVTEFAARFGMGFYTSAESRSTKPRWMSTSSCPPSLPTERTLPIC